MMSDTPLNEKSMIPQSKLFSLTFEASLLFLNNCIIVIGNCFLFARTFTVSALEMKHWL